MKEILYLLYHKYRKQGYSHIEASQKAYADMRLEYLTNALT